MRLFVSVPLPVAQREHLLAMLSGGTTRPDQWHLTLAFLADHDDPTTLADALREVAARHQPFAVRVEGGGTFPGVVWAGIGGDLAALRRLAVEVTSVCGPADKQFRPHLTIARRGSASALRDYRGPEWTVDSIDLVHSILGRSAEHHILDHFPLGT